MSALDAACQSAAALGVTIMAAAAGDNGSSDGVNDGKNHVDFPASSPHVLRRDQPARQRLEHLGRGCVEWPVTVARATSPA
jgi:hypothetical protein